MLIKRIGSISNLGVFQKFVSVGEETDFCKHNLIYGFNGSGKTTLSRIFSSLEHGVLCPLLPDGGHFEIELEDGTVLSPESQLDRLKGKIVVFNSDFIDDNFKWKEGSAKPVFYIGKEQAKLALELQNAERDLEETNETKSITRAAQAKQAGESTKFKRDTARNIGVELGLRNYNALALDSDYATEDPPPVPAITSERRTALRALMLETDPLEKISQLSKELFSATGFQTSCQETRDCLAQTVGTLALADLAQHDTMLNWAKQGHSYHKEQHLESCLLCGGDLTEERMRALELSIDGRFDQIVVETQRLLAYGVELRSRLSLASSRLPSNNDLTKEQRAEYQKACEDYNGICTTVLSALIPFISSLEQKAASPNVALSPVDCIGDPQSKAYEEALLSHICHINATIVRHNESNDEFASIQTGARNTLRKHLLAESCSHYREIEELHENAIAAATDARAASVALTTRVDNLRQQLRNHGPAALAINDLIKCHLRHGEIEIVAVEDGFQLRRQGGQVAKNLSEGEKTAITFCYFLTSLTSDSRKLKDLIVVVDDPISSLDSRALNYVFSVLKGNVSQCAQLIVLTHNINLMNSCRSWLRKSAERGTASLLFLDLKNGANGLRKTAITKLPKLIRDYDSEYHYLFSLVKGFAESTDCSSQYLFLMPNAMRKVAEVFLTFKRPGADGLGSKVEAIASGGYGIDANRFRAIDRLIQLESHADSLDDLVGFSSMTVEESQECAVALMEIIKKLDPDHYRLQCSQCN